MKNIFKKNLDQCVIANAVKQSGEIATPFGLAMTRYKKDGLAMTEQSGRSMVEMLGVLAIVGVLSIGGVEGYTSAMRAYKANEVVNAASILYVMGLASDQGSGTGDLTYETAVGKNPSGVSEIKYSGTAKAISIAFNDEDVYKAVKNKLGDKALNSESASSGGTGTSG